MPRGVKEPVGRLRFVQRALGVLNLFLVVPFGLLALLGRWLPPAICVPCTLAAFALPWLLVLPTLFVGVWGWRRSWRGVLLNLLALAVHWPWPLALLQLHPPKEAGAHSISVMSVNLNEFVYARRPEVTALITFLKGHPADVLCMQEYYELGITDSLPYAAYLARELGYPYHSVTETSKGVGFVTFSKYPILDSWRVASPSGVYGAQALELAVPNDTVRIYNVQLPSYHGPGVAPPSGNTWAARVEQNMRTLQTTWAQHDAHTEALLRDRARTTRPILMCGDLNQQPYGYVYRTLRANLQDSFLAAGWGWGSTHGWGLTALRIDYIMCDARFTVQGYEVIDNPLSDHRAVRAEVSF